MWIDVMECIPGEEGDYLCILDIDKHTRPCDCDPFYHICHFYAEENDITGQKMKAYFHHRCLFKEVTHWMTLPEMPEKSE